MNKKLLLILIALFVFFSCKDPDAPRGAVTESEPVKEAAASSTDYNKAPENAEFVLIAPHNGNLENYNHQALLLLKNYVESRSNNRVGVRIFPNKQLAGNVNEGINGLIDGSFQIFQTTGDAANYLQAISVFDLPYELPDDRIAETVLRNEELVGALRAAALEKIPELRLMMMTNSGGWRNFATVNKPIHSPADLKGVKIRTVPSKVQQELVSILGGVPTGIPWPEVYSSLSTGVVDGTKNGIVDIVSAKLHESLRYYTLDGHAYMTGFWWMSQEMFESMPSDLRQVVVDGFEAMQGYLFSYPKHKNVTAFNEFREKDGTIYTPTKEEMQEFQASSKQAMEDWYLNEYGAEVAPWLELYKRVIAEATAEVNGDRALEIQ